MIFFLLLTAWLGLLTLSTLLGIFKNLRSFAVYLSATSTGALLGALALSTVVLVAASGSYLHGLNPAYKGAAFFMVYAVSIASGAALGVLLSFRLTRHLFRKRRQAL